MSGRVVGGLLALMVLVLLPAAPGGAGASVTSATEPSSAYEERCAGCHGIEGAGSSTGPSLRILPDTTDAEEGVARILREGYGRMGAVVLPEEEVGPISEYVVARFGRDVGASDGEPLYGRHCAECHGSAALGASGPSLEGIPSAMIASAIRTGPPPMPAYDETELSDDEVAAISAFVVEAASVGDGTGLRLLDPALRTAHVLAVVIYLGGGILFHGPLRGGLSLIPPGQASMVGTHVGTGFTYLSWLSLSLWGVTGYWMLFRYGWGDAGSPLTLFIEPDRLSSPEGWSLLVMLAVWYLIVINASIISFVLRPRLARRVDPDATGDAAERVADMIGTSSRWVDILARVNLALTFVGLVSGALFL